MIFSERLDFNRKGYNEFRNDLSKVQGSSISNKSAKIEEEYKFFNDKVKLIITRHAPKYKLFI